MRSQAFFLVVFSIAAQISVVNGADIWEFEDIHTKAHQPFADKETKAIVLVFITTDCPIANYYQPTLSRLAETYAKKDVPFFLVHADRSIKRVEAIEHAKEFRTKAPVILDSKQEIAKHVDARRTPEAFLINREGKTLYSGRINDLYADYGKRRRTAQTHDLRDAIDAFLAGREIEKAKTVAIGCYIPYPKKK